MKNISVSAAGLLIALSCALIAYAQPVDEARNLTSRQEAIVPIAAFSANGDMEKLSAAMNQGLDSGLTVNEIKELIIQMYAYCGFPRSLNASVAFSKALEERKLKGIDDAPGEEAKPIPSGKNSIELGAEIQSELVGQPVSVEAGPNAFIPAIDQFLKGHLFGDIFARGVLDYKDREIATISALAVLGVPQLQGHIRVGFNVGLTEAQVENLISVLETKVGIQESERARNALDRVTAARAQDSKEDSQVVIRREGQPSTKAPGANFSGDVTIQLMFQPSNAVDFVGAYVTFQPGARTAWHTHGAGQHLIVISGVCWTQEWGKEKTIANPGDIVWCPPGVKHWHGASRDAAMTHFALTGIGVPARMQWLEQVTDEQYDGEQQSAGNDGRP